MALFERKRRKIPALNTTSTADISFMLLIFFLVTTSMDIDKGLTRQLPPPSLNKEQQVTDVDKEHVLVLQITENNELLADGKPMPMDSLRQRVATFVGGCKDLKEHVISVDVDRKASYEVYFNMQNEIVAAYNQLRDVRAQQRYHHGFNLCTEEQKEVLRSEIPQRIAEIYHQKDEEGGEP